MYFSLVIFFISLACVHSDQIEDVYCEPPDFPQNGGYGPLGQSYTPGDILHYYCKTKYFIGGNYRRICLDNGEWTGNTPVCDPPAVFDYVDQTSTAEPDFRNQASEAIDGDKYSCASTEAGPDQEWTATFHEVSQVMRIMLFLPRGEVAYEVFIVKEDGSEFSCGGHRREVVRLEWTFHNCAEPHNTGVVGLKIKSTKPDIPLHICEVVSHVITHPTCIDPHVPVENGRLKISRKNAQLECLPGYTESKNTVINCLRTGFWEREPLYCMRSETEKDVVTDSGCGQPEVSDVDSDKTKINSVQSGVNSEESGVNSEKSGVNSEESEIDSVQSGNDSLQTEIDTEQTEINTENTEIKSTPPKIHSDTNAINHYPPQNTGPNFVMRPHRFSRKWWLWKIRRFLHFLRYHPLFNSCCRREYHPVIGPVIHCLC